jgi:hypothetical protein
VALTKDPLFSARSKHIEARYFFIRELVNAGKLQAKHIKGSENVADIFTKPLSKEDHYRLMGELGMHELSKATAWHAFQGVCCKERWKPCLAEGRLQGSQDDLRWPLETVRKNGPF